MAKKNGKYDHITSKLPKLQGIDGEYRENPIYQERVKQTKEAILAERKDGEFEDLGYMRIEDAEKSMKAVHQALLRRCAGQRHATSLAAAYVALRDLKDRIEAWESNTNLLLEAYAQLMVDQMENESVSKMELNGRPLSTWMEPYATVKDKTANQAWAMRECEHCMTPKHEHQEVDGLLVGSNAIINDQNEQISVSHYFAPNELRKSLALPWQTLDSLVRKMLLEGAELPPGVEVFAKTKIRLGAQR